MITELNTVTNKITVTFYSRLNNLDNFSFVTDINIKPLTVEDIYNKIKGNITGLEVLVTRSDSETNYLLIGLPCEVLGMPYYIVSEFDNLDSVYSVKERLEKMM